MYMYMYTGECTGIYMYMHVHLESLHLGDNAFLHVATTGDHVTRGPVTVSPPSDH